MDNENKDVAIPDISGFLGTENTEFLEMDMAGMYDAMTEGGEKQEEPLDDKKPEQNEGAEVVEEEEIKDKKEKGDAVESGVEKTSPTTDNYKRAFAIAQDLVEDGVLDSFDKDKFKELYDDLGSRAISEMLKIQQNESLSTVLDEMKTAVEDYYASIYNAPEQKEFFNLLKKGIDFETAKEVFTEKKAYDSLTDKDLEDNDTLCEKIIMADYERQGLSESRRKRMWDKIKDDPDAIYEDAIEARNNLKEASVQKEKQLVETAKQQEIQEQKNREAQRLNAEKAREQLNSYITEMKAIGEIKITDADRKKIYGNLTTPVDYIPDPSTGQKRPVFFLESIRNKNPNAFNAALTLYAMKGLFNMDSSGNFKPDFSYFDSKAEKKVKSNLDTITEIKTVGTSSTQGSKSGLKDIFN